MNLHNVTSNHGQRRAGPRCQAEPTGHGAGGGAVLSPGGHAALPLGKKTPNTSCCRLMAGKGRGRAPFFSVTCLN